MLGITPTPEKEPQLFMGVMMATGPPLKKVPFAWYQLTGSLHQKNTTVPLSQVHTIIHTLKMFKYLNHINSSNC